MLGIIFDLLILGVLAVGGYLGWIQHLKDYGFNENDKVYFEHYDDIHSGVVVGKQNKVYYLIALKNYNNSIYKVHGKNISKRKEC